MDENPRGKRGGVKVKIRGAGLGKKWRNWLIQKIYKTAQIVIEIFVVYHDILIEENISLLKGIAVKKFVIICT